jgi:D-alanyl-D-alanine carboxypeptidase
MIRRLVALGLVAASLSAATYDDALRDARRHAGARQMAGAVLSHGRVVWTGASGPGARASDVYSLASLSKTYTATVVLRLAARGRLELTDHVSRWLAGRIPAAAARVTVRELLNHTSGLPDYLDDPRIEAALGDPRHHWTEAELLRAVRAPRHRGTFAYSNTNFILLGAILRRVSGERVDRVLAQEVLGPLRLRSTSMQRGARLARRVAGHHRLPNDIWDPIWTDGAVVASAADVGRFLDGLVVSRRLLGASWLQRMLAGAYQGYGLGVYGVPLLGDRAYGHDGSYGGWDSYAVAEPATGLTFVVLAHGGAGSGPDAGVRALARIAAG